MSAIVFSNGGSARHRARLRLNDLHVFDTTAYAKGVPVQPVPAKLSITRSGVFVGIATADEKIEAKMAAVDFMVSERGK